MRAAVSVVWRANTNLVAKHSLGPLSFIFVLGGEAEGQVYDGRQREGYEEWGEARRGTGLLHYILFSGLPSWLADTCN